MKSILSLMLLFAFMISALYASLPLPPYNKSKPPSLSLPLAYERAVAFLGPMTNQFHCISASITTTFTPEGEWYFTFYSTNSNSTPKHIAVEFNGKVVLDSGYR